MHTNSSRDSRSSRVLKKRIETLEVRPNGLYRITETIDYSTTHTTPDFAVIWTGKQENLVEPVRSYHAEYLGPLSAAPEVTVSAPADDPFVTLTVQWGWDVEVSIGLTQAQWELVNSGQPLSLQGVGYRYEGSFFQDHWHFAGGADGDLRVEYGEDGGVGFEGKLSDAEVQIQGGYET